MQREELTKTIRSYWDGVASVYDQRPAQRMLREWSALYSRILSHHDRGLLVADMGAGTGFNSLLIAGLGHQVVAVDLSMNMLRICRQRAEKHNLNISPVQAEASAAPLWKGRFDCVVARNLLWTMPNPAGAMAQWHTLLRPGGLLIIADAQWVRPRFSLFKRRSGDGALMAAYKPIMEMLPYFNGLTADDGARLMRVCEFRQLQVWQDQLSADPYDKTEALSFFVLSGRKAG